MRKRVKATSRKRLAQSISKSAKSISKKAAGRSSDVPPAAKAPPVVGFAPLDSGGPGTLNELREEFSAGRDWSGCLRRRPCRRLSPCGGVLPVPRGAGSAARRPEARPNR